MATYHFSLTTDEDFGQAVTSTRKALMDHGFGVLTEIDVAATLKEKLGVERPSYLILGACNPGYAHQALSADPGIGVLLPCNVVVREQDDGSVVIDFMDPIAVLNMVDHPGIDKIAHDVRSLLEQVRDAIANHRDA